jgi:retinol-binding protein 3
MPNILSRRVIAAALATCQLCITVALAGPDNPTKSAARQSESVQPSAAIDARARRELLEQLAGVLESQYVIEGTAKKLGSFLRAKAESDSYGSISSGPELARVLTHDLYSVAHDKHLRVSYSFTPLPLAPKGVLGPPPKDVLDQIRRMNGGIPKVEILDGNVGYMRVNGVPVLAAVRSAVAAAFAFLHNTDALIIDNRGNGGGDPNTVAFYVSYLSDGKPFVVNTFHWRAGHRVEEFRTTDLGDLAYGARKPVFVLTSPATFSGGEELSYDLQTLKRAVIVGELTGGGANPGGPVSLGKHFLVNVPLGQAVNPVTGTSWEGVGVKPDVAVPAATALSKAHALAIERLLSDASDPRSRALLKAVSMELQSIADADSGAVTRLTNDEVTGTYAPEAGPGLEVAIFEKGGRLIQHLEGFPDATLTIVGGNRYRLEGYPDGYFTSFRAAGGKTELLLEAPVGPATILAKDEQ